MKRFVLLLLLARISWCALPNLTTWEVRTLGAATNGGGFVTGASGTDMSVFNNKNAAACMPIFHKLSLPPNVAWSSRTTLPRK